MNLFELFVKIGVDDQASSNIANITKKLGNGLKTAAKIGTAAVTAAATGIAALTSASIKNYAEYEQLVGGVDTLFKNSSKKIQKYAANAYKTAGMSANDYMSTVTSFSASLLQSLAGDTEAAAEYADQAITDMSDNANKMGTDMTLIQNAYQGFAKANYTMLDNLKLGYGGTQEEMKRLIADAAALSDTVDAGSMSFANIVQAIHVVQTEMGITGTTAKEAASTISGSVSSMKAAWSNLMTGIADDNANFDKLMNNWVSSVETVAGNILPRIEVALGGVSSLINGLVPIIVEKLPGIASTVLTGLIQNAATVMNSLSAALPELITTLLPIIIDQAPLIVEAGISLMRALVSGFLQAITDPDVAKSLLNAVVEISKLLINRRVEMVKSAVGMIKNLASGFIENIDVILPAVTSFIEEVVGFIKENASPFIESAITIISTLATGLMENISQIIPTIFLVVESIVGYLSDNAEQLISTALTFISTLATALIENVSNLLPTIMSFVTQLVQMLVTEENLSKLLTVALAFISSLATALIENISTIMPAVLQIIVSLVEFFTQPDVLGPLLDAAVAIIMALMDFLMKPETLESLLNAAMDIIDALLNFITENLGPLLDAALAIIMSLLEFLMEPETLDRLIDAAIDIVDALVAFIMDNLEPLLDAAVDIIMALVDYLLDPERIKKMSEAGTEIVAKLALAIIDAAFKIGEAARELVSKLWNKLSTTDWKGLGKNIVDGLLEGLKKAWKSLSKWVDESWDGLVGGIKDFLGIKSPSRLFRDEIGKMMVKGLGIGFDDEMPKVERSINNDMEHLINSLDTELYPTVNYGTSERPSGDGAKNIGAGIGAVNININGAQYSDEQSLAAAVAEALQNLYERGEAVYA